MASAISMPNSRSSDDHHSNNICWQDNDINEAYADFHSLHTLTASLIFRLLTTRYELEGDHQYSCQYRYQYRYGDEDEEGSEMEKLRRVDELLSTLLTIKQDTDILITTFAAPDSTHKHSPPQSDSDALSPTHGYPNNPKPNPPSIHSNHHNPFLSSNLYQSHLISRLSTLLPSLQPFLPTATPEPSWQGFDIGVGIKAEEEEEEEERELAANRRWRDDHSRRQGSEGNEDRVRRAENAHVSGIRKEEHHGPEVKEEEDNSTNPNTPLNWRSPTIINPIPIKPSNHPRYKQPNAIVTAIDQGRRTPVATAATACLTREPRSRYVMPSYTGRGKRDIRWAAPMGYADR